MVTVKHHAHYTLVTLTPNRSASWRDSKWLMWLIASVAFIIAVVWAIVGVWLVFPFAGIEIGLFCFLLYRVNLLTYSNQSVSIEKHQIHVQYSNKAVKSVSLPREDTHMELSESPQDWYLPQLKLVSAENSVAIGDFLNKEDRQTLYETIKDLGIPAWRHHWWKH